MYFDKFHIVSVADSIHFYKFQKGRTKAYKGFGSGCLKGETIAGKTYKVF